MREQSCPIPVFGDKKSQILEAIQRVLHFANGDVDIRAIVKSGEYLGLAFTHAQSCHHVIQDI
jgi:hypothetical protein